MSGVILFRAPGSPPARACCMLADIIRLKLEYRNVNLLKMEHRTDEFKKLNPMCTVPVLQDGDFVLSESNAIMKYMLSKYGAEHEARLYPADLRQRALVDQCLFFNAATFFAALRVVGAETIFSNLKGPTPAHIAGIEKCFGIVEAYLQSRPYIATDHLTLADLAAGSTATAIQTIQKLDKDKYPRAYDWVSRLEEESFFKTINKEGVEYFGKVINGAWKKNKLDNAKKKA